MPRQEKIGLQVVDAREVVKREKIKTARLSIALEPEEKELAEQFATEYSRRAGTEMTLSSFVRHLIRQAALNATGESELNQQRLALPPIRPKRRPRPSEQLAIYREEIKAIALAHHVTNVRVFGSTARGEDTSKSDLDLLVSPIKGKTGLMELVEIAAKVKKLIKVPVDVVLDTEIPEKHRGQNQQGGNGDMIGGLTGLPVPAALPDTSCLCRS